MSNSRIIAHYFTPTEEAKRIASLLTSALEEKMEMPLGFRILGLFSSFSCYNVYTASKPLGKPDGHVRRAMMMLPRHGLADFAVTRANKEDHTGGRRVLWWITDEGRVLAERSVEAYNQRVHRCKGGKYCKHQQFNV